MSACGARDANASVVSRAFEMGDVRDLVGHHGAASASVFGPSVDAGLEEGAVDDQLSTPVEQVEQALPAFRPFELVRLLDGEPRHPPALGTQRVTGTCQLLLFHEQLLARRLPLLVRHDRGCVHDGLLSRVD